MTKILVPSGWGAKLQGCKKGPDVLKDHLAPPFITISPKNDLGSPLSIILDVNERLCFSLAKCLQQKHFPIVLGGDHSIAVGTWKGLALAKNLPFGLIWIDAHMDAHNLTTSPSKAWHGMPLRALLDKEHELLPSRQESPLLNPASVCLIGVRSYEREEFDFLKNKNIRIYFIDEVKQRGLKTVFNEALHLVNKETCGFGVSLDIDAVDPEEAPGVGSPEPNGISGMELLTSLPLLKKDQRLLAFELVEYNPERDVNQKTLNLCLNLSGGLSF